MSKELIERLKNEGDGVMSRREKTLLAGYIEELEKERDQLRNELEIERMRNVACGVVAMADTPDSAKQARDMHPDYMSAACSDVARRVDECIKLREQVTLLRDAVAYGVDNSDFDGETFDRKLRESLTATEQKL